MALKLTPSGTDLLLRAIAGEINIKFTAIQLGNGADAGKSAAALSNPLLTAEISSYEVGDVFVTLRTTFSNSQVSASFRATEVGVLAHDPDTEDGTLLYAYQYTPEGESDYIPASADKVLETQMDVLVYIGDAENVTASISQSLAYASRAELEAHVQNKGNPHKVTAEQVGLGNVSNVSTNDQTPTYAEASALVGLKSGEKLSISFGKIAKAVSSLIAHTKNDENPHKVTAEQVNAAAKDHKHSTNDLTGGVLGVARGGTGVTGYDKLLDKLGLSNVVLHNLTELAFTKQSDWRDIAYGNGVFVAVAQGRVAYSENGINWTEIDLQNSGMVCYSVAFGNGKFVATGAGYKDYYYSEDGINWTKGKLPLPGTWFVAYGNGRFVTVDNGSNADTVLYSEDGVNWTSTPMTVELESGSKWATVRFVNDRFIALASYQISAYSKDGVNWTKITLPSSTNYQDAAYYKDIAYGNGKYVAVGKRAISYSEDGINWTKASAPTTEEGWFSVTYGGGRFVAISYNHLTTTQSRLYAYSEDGINWKTNSVPNNCDWRCVHYEKGRFIMVGDGTGISISTDGINWVRNVSSLTTLKGDDITLEVFISAELQKRLEG